jgi:hypothetical protein
VIAPPFGEVAPLAPAGAWAVAALSACIVFVVCSGLSAAWAKSFGAFLQWLGNLGISFSAKIVRVNVHPFGYAHTIDRKVRNYLWSAQAGSERAMVYALNQSATFFWMAIDTTARLAEDVYDGMSALWHHATKTVPKTIAQVNLKPLQRQIAHERARVASLTRTINADLAQLRHRVAAIAGDVAIPFPRIGRIEREAANQAKRLKKLEKLLGAAGAAGLVLVALRKLKLTWIRCPNVGRFGRHLCGMPSVLMDALLAGLTLVIATEGLVPFARQVQGLIGDAEGVVRKFWHVSAVGQGGDRQLGDSTLST